MPFNSNVAPKRRIKAVAEWVCRHCDRKVARYFNRCPSCGEDRPKS